MSLAVYASLEAGRIAEALVNLQAFAKATSMPYSVVSRITTLSESYAMLSQFLIDGVPDPHRGEIAADISAECAAICASIEREAYVASDEPTLYFSTLRFERTRSDETISALLQTYSAASGRPDTPPATSESLATRLFNRVWVTYPLSASDAEALHVAVASATLKLPEHARTLLIGALLLGSLRYFDSRRAIILADTYRINHESPLGAVALTALILTLASAPSRATGNRKLSAALAALADIPGLAAAARTSFMQLIRSRDTERVSRKLTDELIPGIMKLRPDINNRMRNLDKSEASPFDEDGGLNPQWEDMFEKSGLGDKLRELSELQSEGADVMMATMGNLKDFAFFNDPANWFLPFYSGHSVASSPEMAQLARSIDGLPMMCDSDKYSLVLLASRMGGGMMGAGLTAHLDEQEKQWRELRNSDLDAEAKGRADAANSFVQNVYRFFKLFRRKAEFIDPFVRPINPLATPLLRDSLASDAEALAVAAEFYFRRGHYDEALDLFRRIEELTPPSAELFQKMGYALEMTGQYDSALEAYRTADLIDSESVWTLRRIASLLGKDRRYAEALEIYDRIEVLKPERLSDIMSRARCLMEMHRLSDALALLYKADYLKPDRPDTLRLMAKCQLVTDDSRKALATCERLAALVPTDENNAYDRIIYGHANLGLGNLRAAIRAYSDFIAANNFDKQLFLDTLASDRPLMERVGADNLTINIITEAAIAAASELGTKLNK